MTTPLRVITRIRELAARGIRPADIGWDVGIPARKIRQLCAEHNIALVEGRMGQPQPSLTQWERESGQRSFLFDQDYAFKRAMLRARKTGSEQVTIGVSKSYGEFRPQHFEREITFSACGSQAAQCADQADDQL